MPKNSSMVNFSEIRKSVLAMSYCTHTPVNYWLGMPIRQLWTWMEDFLELKKAADGAAR